MKQLMIILCLVNAAMPACAQNIPSTEQSVATIAALKLQVDSLDAAINRRQQAPAVTNDLQVRFRRSALNALFSAYAGFRVDDIQISLLPTCPAWSERRSMLGMTVQNSVDVDSGRVVLDLKKFECGTFNRNTLDVDLEIEGGGTIGVSGRYAGVPVHASPGLMFYLADRMRFGIMSGGADTVLLKPEPHTFLLKTKMTIRLLDWTLPYYREVPIEANGIVGPILLPLSVSSTVMFPAPYAADASQRLAFIPRGIRLSHTSVWAQGEQLEFRADVNFSR